MNNNAISHPSKVAEVFRDSKFSRLKGGFTNIHAELGESRVDPEIELIVNDDDAIDDEMDRPYGSFLPVTHEVRKSSALNGKAETLNEVPFAYYAFTTTLADN
jgi:hypothetical protein